MNANTSSNPSSDNTTEQSSVNDNSDSDGNSRKRAFNE